MKTHYVEISLQNSKRRVALGLSGDGTLEGAMNPFCGALDGERSPLAGMVDCPGCKALLLLRLIVGAAEAGSDVEDIRVPVELAAELLTALGDSYRWPVRA